MDKKKSKEIFPAWKKILIIFGGILFGLLSAEIIVRILPNTVTKIDMSLKDEDRIFLSSREMRFRPNLTRVWTGLGRPTIWHFNELGYREREVQVDKPSNIYRIAFIGDSIVMGFGVEEYQALPRRLENYLRPEKFENNMTHFEVLNYGIQGYATPHYLAVLKEDVLRAKPNVVIVGFYTNDIQAAASFEANKKYTLLKAIPDLIPFKLNQFLKHNSRLFLLILNRYYSMVEKTSVRVPNDESVEDIGWNYVERDLAKMQELTSKNGIKLVVLGIPNSALEVGERNVSKKRIEKLKQISDQYGISYYELFEDLVKNKDAGKLYLEKFDDHFSIEGNEYVAKLVGDYLNKNSIIPVIK